MKKQVSHNLLLRTVLCVVGLQLFNQGIGLASDESYRQLPGGRVGTYFDLVLPAKGGAPPYSWKSRGTLPEGIQLTHTGVLRGTFEKEGRYNFEVVVTDSLNDSKSQKVRLVVESQEIKIKPLQIESQRLPAALKGRDFSLFLAASGGLPPYTWAATKELPAGLKLDTTTGEIRGLAQEEESVSIEVTVSDSQGNPAKVSRKLTLEVLEMVPGTVNWIRTTPRWLKLVLIWLFLLAIFYAWGKVRHEKQNRKWAKDGKKPVFSFDPVKGTAKVLEVEDMTKGEIQQILNPIRYFKRVIWPRAYSILFMAILVFWLWELYLDFSPNTFTQLLPF
ncbi:MAG: putative Ig domain-containing protein [Nitrospira sp.]|nr:putative Ig domain-containing protein [Nitrospira sp.]